MKKNTVLFEIAWETCNQIGGIYTFIKSKIPSILDNREGHYYLLGPYFPNLAKLDFKAVAITENCAVGKTIIAMQHMGYEIHLGHWLLDSSRPLVILFNPDSAFNNLNDLKKRLWEDHEISSLNTDSLTDQVIAFGDIVRLFFTTLEKFSDTDQDFIAHFHDWMSAAALPFLKKEKARIATVFTNHATVCGRYITPNEYDYCDKVNRYDWRTKAVEYNIEAPAGIERAAAQSADTLTTISESAALECKIFLGREPDMVIPRGLNFKQKFSHESFSVHQKNRAIIDEFVKGLFFPSYHFNTEKTIYFFTSGRYEFRNKGFDVTLRALELLNKKLSDKHSEMTIVSFLIAPRPFYSVRAELLESRARYKHMHKLCQKISSKLGPRLYNSVTNQGNSKMPDINSLLDDELVQTWKKAVAGFKQKELPPVSTHHLVYPDEVTDFCQKAGLDNSKNTKVKVVYHNEFMERATSLLGMDYADFVSGCHLGIFPDLYQPWGYAPMEAAVLGTPTVTSNLSGFGAFIEKHVPDHDSHELYILNRKNKSVEDASHQLADKLFSFIKNLEASQFIPRAGIRDTAIAKLCWSEIQAKYEESYRLALLRSQPKTNLY